MGRGPSRAELIVDLRQVAEEIDGTPSLGDYEEHCEWSKTSLYREFDSIYEAREAAGLDASDQRGVAQTIDSDDLLAEIHRLADELGRPPKRDEMIEQGEYSEGPYTREFGTWGEAVVAAGYEPHRPNSELADYVSKTCEWCGQIEDVLASNLPSGQENWFCSLECKHEWQAEYVVGENHHQYNRVTITCEQCGETREALPAVVENRDQHFCSKDCHSQWLSESKSGEAHRWWEGGRTTLECDYCGDEYEVKPSRDDQSRFCSYECLGKARKSEMAGEGNPNWAGGYEPYYGPNWRQQRKNRLQFDEYQCVVCGLTDEEHKREYGAELSVHHVTPFVEFVDDNTVDYKSANRLVNLRTMCIDCHQQWEGLPVAPIR